MFRLFIDTSVIVSALLLNEKEHIPSLAILLQNRYPLVTNRYVIKELRHVLPKFVDTAHTERFIEIIAAKFTVVATPSPNEFKKIKCRDRSDAPLICSALKEKCIFITEYLRTRQDADKYILSFGSKELVELLKMHIPETGKKTLK